MILNFCANHPVWSFLIILVLLDYVYESLKLFRRRG